MLDNTDSTFANDGSEDESPNAAERRYEAIIAKLEAKVERWPYNDGYRKQLKGALKAFIAFRKDQEKQS